MIKRTNYVDKLCKGMRTSLGQFVASFGDKALASNDRVDKADFSTIYHQLFTALKSTAGRGNSPLSISLIPQLPQDLLLLRRNLKKETIWN